jgi:hypothetical protein
LTVRFIPTALSPAFVWDVSGVNRDRQRSWRKRGLVGSIVARDGRHWRYDLWDVARFVVLDHLPARERTRADLVTIAASRIADVILWDEGLWTIVGDPMADLSSLRASLYRERDIPIEATRRYLLTHAPGRYEFTDNHRLKSNAASVLDLDLLAAQMKIRLREPVMRVEI